MKTPVEIILARRAAVALRKLDWANLKLRFELSWDMLKPGGLVKLNPKLLK